jgi:hypothetical protein
MMGRWFGRHLGGTDSMIDAVAEVTGLTADEVRAKLADGESLSDIITESGATVEEAVDAYIAARVAALQAECRVREELGDLPEALLRDWHYQLLNTPVRPDGEE